MHVLNCYLLCVFPVRTRLLTMKRTLKSKRIHDVEFSKHNDSAGGLFLLLNPEGTA